MGYIIGSQKRLSCSFAPEGAGRREDYDGSITKFGLDLGLTRDGFMVWSVFTNTVAGPGFPRWRLRGGERRSDGRSRAGSQCVGRGLKPDCRTAAYITRRADGPQCRYWCCSSSSRASAAMIECLIASRASRSARSLAIFSRIACWAALYSASASAP